MIHAVRRLKQVNSTKSLSIINHVATSIKNNNRDIHNVYQHRNIKPI